MTTNHEQMLAARIANLGVATDFVEAWCATHGVARGDTLRLTLLIEELFTNTVEHGHGGDCDAPVRLALSLLPQQLILQYEDRSPHFDPVHYLATAPPEPMDEPDARPPGGWGLRMVQQMAQSLEHEAVEGGNRLRIVMSRQG
jgi:serine/threonine-protein kinase RsbW